MKRFKVLSESDANELRAELRLRLQGIDGEVRRAIFVNDNPEKWFIIQRFSFYGAYQGEGWIKQSSGRARDRISGERIPKGALELGFCYDEEENSWKAKDYHVALAPILGHDFDIYVDVPSRSVRLVLKPL